MTRMPYCSRFATAQSMARITSLTWPDPSAVEHLQVDQVRARRHARVLLGRPPARWPARRRDARHVRAVPVRVAVGRRPAGEVHLRDDALCESPAASAIPESTTAMPTPRPVSGPARADALPAPVGADRLVGHRHVRVHRRRRPTASRPRRILAERLQLRGVHAEHAAGRQPSPRARRRGGPPAPRRVARSPRTMTSIDAEPAARCSWRSRDRRARCAGACADTLPRPARRRKRQQRGA